MKKNIFDFKKTRLFICNQWECGLEDNILCKVLPYIRCIHFPEVVLIVTPSFLQKRNMFKDIKSCLVLVVKKANVLITAYWCDKPEYLLENKQKNIQILQ